MIRHVVVVGLMGSGKTTVGQELAQILGWELSDSDATIEAQTGATVRELQTRDGIDVVHEAEARHLLDAVRALEPSVICAAASVVDDPACREALRSPPVATIWLRGSPAALAARFHDQGHRPEFGDDLLGFLTDQANARRAHFESSSTVVVDIDGRTPAEIVFAAAALLDRHGALDIFGTS